MRRVHRPPALTDVDVDFAVVVKNTFLEVHGAAESSGLSTAPAALTGAVKHGLAKVSEQDNCALDGAAAVNQGKPVEESDVETETTAATPSSSESLYLWPPTPDKQHLWPPTPGSPGARVRISLAELTDAEVMVAPTDATIVAGYCQLQADYWEHSSSLWDFPTPAHQPLPLPPPGSPKLPKHFADFENNDDCGACMMLSDHPLPAANQIFACLANARMPKCAPPCAPAPRAPEWSYEEAPSLGLDAVSSLGFA